MFDERWSTAITIRCVPLLASLSETAIDVLIDGVAQITSPYSAVALHHFHGAATRSA